MQIVRTVAAPAPGDRSMAQRPARRARWCPPWALSTRATWRCSPPRAIGPAAPPPAFSSIPPSSGRARIWTAIPGGSGEDAEALRAAGCDLLFAPGADEMYPQGFATTVSVAALSDRLCGRRPAGPFRRRRHHRRQAAQPGAHRHRAIRRKGLAAAGDHPPPDRRSRHPRAHRRRSDRARGGRPRPLLAQRLSVDSRARSRARSARRTVRGEDGAGTGGRTLAGTLDAAREALEEAGFAVDYIELAGADDLQPVERPDRPARLFAAAWIGGTRLIDNVPVAPARQRQSAG